MTTIWAVLLALGVFWPAVVSGWPVETMNATINATNFIVNGRCSGTLISVRHRAILTNNHCVEQKITVVDREETTPEGKVRKFRREKREDVPVAQHVYKGYVRVGSAEYQTEIVGYSKKRDLALLQMKAEAIPHTLESRLLPDKREVTRGERVFIVGNPAGLDATVVEGVVSSVTRTFEFPWLEEKLPFIQFSGGIYGGNSGGALYNDDGFLIGVPAAGHREAAFIGLAIPVSIIKDFLREVCWASIWQAEADDAQCRKALAEKAKAEGRNPEPDK